MLILAGVSLNAIVGDNGIITRAQEANMQSSIASLEEFLQLKYTENYEQMAQYQSKIEGLTNVCSGYFYIPINEGWGTLRYVVDSDGHALYLIKKSGLPEEIRESLVGGDAGAGGYGDYQSLNDVYGVTSNLKVYYCSEGADSIKGLAKENLDNDNPLRKVFDSESNQEMYSFLENYDVDKDKTLNAEELKSINELIIDSTSNVTNLEDLFNLSSLKKLTLKDTKLNNLKGIENVGTLTTVFINSCKISDYSALGLMNSRLEYLYLINFTNEELSLLCDGLRNNDMVELEFLGVVGYENTNLEGRVSAKAPLTDDSGCSALNNIECFSKLTVATKNAIKYLELYRNSITDINVLQDFKNLYYLRLDNNHIKSLNALLGLSTLTYLHASDNDLGIEEENELNSLDSLSALKSLNLYFLNLSYNSYLKHINYLSDVSTLKYFYLEGCSNIISDEIFDIKEILLACDNYSIDSKYNLSLLDESTTLLNLSNETISKNVFQSLKNYRNLTALCLTGISLTDENDLSLTKDDFNTTINDTLRELTNLEYLILNGLSNLNSLNFVESTNNKGTTKLKELDLRGTGVTDLTPLNSLSSLVQLFIDNKDSNLNEIQGTIDRLIGSTKSFSDGQLTDVFANATGLNLGYSSDLFTKLENCENITCLCFNFQRGTSSVARNFSLDLSKCSNLRKLELRHAGIKSVKLPQSIEDLDLYYSKGNGLIELPNFSNLINLKKIKLDALDTASNLADSTLILKQLMNSNNLEYFSWSEFVGLTFSFDFDFPKLNTFIFNVGSGYENYRRTEILFNNQEKATKINSIQISGVSLSNCDLFSKFSNLKSLAISNNNISNLNGLSNLKNLESLNLKNNSLSDTFTYLDEGGQSVTKNNLDILANLNKIGKLKNLYLAGNAGIIDYSAVENLTWTDWSGFNGK